MCVGGNGAATDRGEELASYGKLNSAGTNLSGAGANATGTATDYFTRLLSGNPAATAAAEQPALNAAAGQIQQQKQVIANQGGARTGGTNAATQQIGQTADAGVQDAAAKARSGAAGSLAQIGGQETGQGLDATKALSDAATANRTQSAQLHADAVKNWSNVLNGAMDGKGIIPTVASTGWAG
jgi:hypothetical protein